jgi:hypothetical protein
MWAEPAAPCFASLYDFLIAGPDDCPIAWPGITLYGRLDYGAGYESHGVPFNGNYPNGAHFKEQQCTPLHDRAEWARTVAYRRR